MACQTGFVEKFYPPLAEPVCVPMAASGATVPTPPKAKAANDLPPWILAVIQNADKIGAGIGAATGKYQAPATPTGDVYAPPVAPPAQPIDQTWIWAARIGIVLVIAIVIGYLIKKGRVPVAVPA
jgi:hypothetical protein